MTVGSMPRNSRPTKSHKRKWCLHPYTSMYIYLSSKVTASYPENTASDFTVQLPQALCDIKESGTIEVRLHASPKNPLFVCADFCAESIVNSKTLPVLRRVSQKTFLPSCITYIPLRVRDFHTVRIYICKESGEPINLQGETKVTLHL